MGNTLSGLSHPVALVAVMVRFNISTFSTVDDDKRGYANLGSETGISDTTEPLLRWRYGNRHAGIA